MAKVINLLKEDDPASHHIKRLGRLDSNQGMAVPKTAALPLGYARLSLISQYRKHGAIIT
jgi:hypothetical protein